MATDNNIVLKVNNIEKSKNDRRLYRGLKLNNGLTALLISDPHTKTSAASMTIAVGSFSDPVNQPGLANLSSHLINLGTQKYPAESGFEKFLTVVSGSQNTSVGNSSTSYNFGAYENVFPEALDRFSQFFNKPIFTASAVQIQKLIMLVQHKQNINDDKKRICQMVKNGIDPNHPLYQNYGTATRNILLRNEDLEDNNIYEDVQQFILKWYSSNLMYLTVLGKENLNTLEKMVVSLFGTIKNNNIDMPYWNEPIYKTEQLAVRTIIVPLRDITELHLTFPIPYNAEHYKSQPTWYFNYLLLHEGPNSVLGILKYKRWSTGLTAGTYEMVRGNKSFQIKIHLTKEGFNHVNDIITLIFQFFNMLKKKRHLPKSFYEEYRNSHMMLFDFQQKLPVEKYVTKLSTRMVNTKLEDILTATELVQDWRPDLIKEILSYIRPDNMRMTIVSKEFHDMEFTEDKNLGTLYAINKIPEETLKMWQEANTCEYLKMPPTNKFISTSTRLVDINENEPDQPWIYYESMRLRCWLKKDTKFRMPHSFISISFSRKNIVTEVSEYTMKFLFLELFKNDFDQYIREARFANYNLNVKTTYSGFQVSFDGFDQNLHVLFQEFIHKIATYKIDKMRYLLNVKNIIKQLEINDPSPMNLILFHQKILLKLMWPYEEIKNTAENLTIENIEEFITTFMTQARMEMLVYGNVDKKKALKLVKILKKSFVDQEETSFNDLPFLKFDETNLKFDGNANHFHKEVNGLHACTSATCLMLHVGTYSTKMAVIAKLFDAILKKRLLYHLKLQLFTRAHPRCTASSDFIIHGDAMFLTFVIESLHNPSFVVQIIENHLENLWKLLPSMTAELLEKWKNRVENTLLRKPRDMTQQMNVYQNEFTYQKFDFNRTQAEVEELRLITKRDVLRFYRKFIKKTGLRRRIFTIFVQPDVKDVLFG